MTLLFYCSHYWKKVKIGLRQGNVILFIASAYLLRVQSIFKERTRKTLEIT